MRVQQDIVRRLVELAERLSTVDDRAVSIERMLKESRVAARRRSRTAELPLDGRSRSSPGCWCPAGTPRTPTPVKRGGRRKSQDQAGTHQAGSLVEDRERGGPPPGGAGCRRDRGAGCARPARRLHAPARSGRHRQPAPRRGRGRRRRPDAGGLPRCRKPGPSGPLGPHRRPGRPAGRPRRDRHPLRWRPPHHRRGRPRPGGPAPATGQRHRPDVEPGLGSPAHHRPSRRVRPPARRPARRGRPHRDPARLRGPARGQDPAGLRLRPAVGVPAAGEDVPLPHHPTGLDRPQPAGRRGRVRRDHLGVPTWSPDHPPGLHPVRRCGRLAAALHVRPALRP